MSIKKEEEKEEFSMIQKMKIKTLKYKIHIRF